MILGRVPRWGLALLLAGLVAACGTGRERAAPEAVAPEAAPEAEAPAAQMPPEAPAEAPAPPVAGEEKPEEAPPAAEAEPPLPPTGPVIFEDETSVESIPPPPAEPETYEVMVPESEYAFIPRQLTIYEGDTVVWRNESGVVHLFATIPGSDPTGRMEIEPEDLLVGASVSHTFHTAGTYPYFCFIHNRMTGKIVVLPR